MVSGPDPTYFPLVLSYLREVRQDAKPKKLAVEGDVAERVLKEAQFYGLEGLERLIIASTSLVVAQGPSCSLRWPLGYRGADGLFAFLFDMEMTVSTVGSLSSKILKKLMSFVMSIFGGILPLKHAAKIWRWGLFYHTFIVIKAFGFPFCFTLKGVCEHGGTRWVLEVHDHFLRHP